MDAYAAKNSLSNPQDNILLKRFAYDHLEPSLQEVSKPFATLAERLDPANPLHAEALTKLWEAKNLVVLAAARPEERI